MKTTNTLRIFLFGGVILCAMNVNSNLPKETVLPVWVVIVILSTLLVYFGLREILRPSDEEISALSFEKPKNLKYFQYVFFTSLFLWLGTQILKEFVDVKFLQIVCDFSSLAIFPSIIYWKVGKENSNRSVINFMFLLYLSIIVFYLFISPKDIFVIKMIGYGFISGTMFYLMRSLVLTEGKDL